MFKSFRERMYEASRLHAYVYIWALGIDIMLILLLYVNGTSISQSYLASYNLQNNTRYFSYL